MGGLRLVLALSVVLWHLEETHQTGHVFIVGDVAVQTFYVISGFFISMVLSEKYVGPGALRLFYGNRLLRIFGTYLPVLILTIGAHLAFPAGWEESNLLWHPSLWPPFSFSAAFLLVFANLFIFAQDLCLFLALDPAGTLHFTRDFAASDPPLFLFLAIGPAWSLAVELSFYLIAPLIVRRSVGCILLVSALSVGARIIAARHGLQNDPWNYRFFPFEIASFLLGTLSYRMWTVVQRCQIAERWPYAGTAALALVVVMLATVTADKGYFSPWKIMCYLVAAALLPVIHASTRLDPLDRALGELSYPIYLCHLTVIYVSDRIAALFGVTLARPLLILLDLGMSIGLAVLLVRVVEVPINRYRRHRLATSRGTAGLLSDVRSRRLQSETSPS